MEGRYIGPQDSWYLWPIMEMKDGGSKPSGKWYNDWGVGWFETISDSAMDQYHTSKADTLRQTGKRYRNKVVEGNFGAYTIADDPKYPYYVVEWVGEPWKAELDKEVLIDVEEFVVHKDGWICKGI